LKNFSPKNTVKAVGFEDGFFPPKLKEVRGQQTVLAAVLTENITPKSAVLNLIEIDGLDATEKALATIQTLNIKYSVNIVLLGGITYAGFNIIDPVEIFETFNIPVIVVTDEEPSDEEVKRALKKHFIDWKERFSIFKKFRKLAKIHRIRKDKGKLYIQPLGISCVEAENLVLKLILKGKYPEPLRLAKSIASSLAKLIFSNYRYLKGKYL